MFDSVKQKHGNPPTHSTWQQLFIKTSQKINILERAFTSSESNAAVQDPLEILTTTEPTRENTNKVRDDESHQAPDFQSDEVRDSLESQSLRGSTPEPDVPRSSVSRYGRIRKQTHKIWQYQRQIAMSAIIATHEDMDDFDIPTHSMAYLAKNSADTMYFDQTISQPDRNQFIQAIVKEVNDHIDHKHWRLIHISEVPEDQKVLPSVWSMKRKRDIKTQEVRKWKARLNVHGGKQIHGVNYWETFAPVVTWITIRLLLILTVLNNWKSRQIDFILTYPQAGIQVPMYMELPKCI